MLTPLTLVTATDLRSTCVYTEFDEHLAERAHPQRPHTPSALARSRAAFALGSLVFFFCYGGAIVAIPALANRVYGGGEHTVDEDGVLGRERGVCSWMLWQTAT